MLSGASQLISLIIDIILTIPKILMILTFEAKHNLKNLNIVVLVLNEVVPLGLGLDVGVSWLSSVPLEAFRFSPPTMMKLFSLAFRFPLNSM